MNYKLRCGASMPIRIGCGAVVPGSRQSGAPVAVGRCHGWLFGTGITTHVLLSAALRNPTVRARYVAVQDVLAEHGRLDFHEELLNSLGADRLSRDRVREHLARDGEVFDIAARRDRSRFPFASDLSPAARPIAIDASSDLIERGLHREAIFWIAVTQARWALVLAPGVPDGYRELLADLGIATAEAVRKRSASAPSRACGRSRKRSSKLPRAAHAERPTARK